MKKLFFASVMILLTATSAFAQDDKGGAAFSKGQSTLSIGYGFASPYKKLFKLTGGFFSTGTSTTTKYSAVGPVGVTYEYGVSDKVSLGLQVAYSTNKNVNTTPNYFGSGKPLIETQKLTQLSGIFRANYHFGSSAKFDPYAGLGLGYGNFKYTDEDNDPSNTSSYNTFAIPTSFGITGQLGARYYFSDNVGIYAEVGYLAGSFAQAGVTFKF